MDEAVLEWVARNRTPWLTSFARGLMNLGTSLGVLAAVALLGAVYIVVRRRWTFGLVVTASFFAASILAAVLKTIIRRPRPTATYALVHLTGFAMPSTHAVRTAALAAAALGTAKWLTPSARRLAVAIAIGGVVVVGAAMVYLGGHWLSDVIVGWAIGGSVGATCAVIIPRLLASGASLEDAVRGCDLARHG